MLTPLFPLRPLRLGGSNKHRHSTVEIKTGTGILEEKDPEPEFIRTALKKVVEARLRMDSLSESAKQQWEKLDKMLSETGGSEIYTLVELLEALGFRLAVMLKEENNA